MERIIKFRAWIPSEKTILSWDALKGTQALDDGFEENDCVLMQFTGLTDKFGKEIWEGDILCFVPVTSRKFKNPYDPWVVEWDSERGAWPQWGPRGENGPEVIGNIWEHPDLLEPK